MFDVLLLGGPKVFIKCSVYYVKCLMYGLTYMLDT